MRRSGHSVDVIEVKNQDNPKCAHGPTLLFEEYRGTKIKRFFACSAFRDRKECSFYQSANGKKVQSEIAVDERFEIIPSKEECADRLDEYRHLSDADRSVCQKCGLLLLPRDRVHHDQHPTLHSVKLSSLDRPTGLFTCISNTKSFSQFMFTDQTVEFVLNSLIHIGFQKMLCIGTPRIHELIRIRRKKGDTCVDSLLLDLDKRYQQTWPDSSFCHYNLFNHHFFHSPDRDIFESFMVSRTGQTVVILDPPFGGLIDPIASTLGKISQVCGGEVKVVWFFPYFMESRLKQACPSLVMLDYQVDYDNHNLFQSGGRKHGSPVRIFTNISPASIVLPSSLGYWFCSVCEAYRHANNWHCDVCGVCTSKDGSRYVHCDKCRRCVKPSRIHCVKCEQCMTQDHKCGEILSPGCHVCGETTHKRRECPNKSASMRKRKKVNHSSEHKKK